MADEHEEPLS